MTLKNRLKERRAALNVNQQEMGRLCGVSRQTISLIERGDYSPSVTLALTIAKVCGVTVEDVFYCRRKMKMNMERNEIKEANRKAMPGFLLLALVGAIVGGIVGFYSAEYDVEQLAGSMKSAGAFFGKYVSSWILLAIAVITPIVVIPVYQKTKRLLLAWDGEDESICDIAEKKLNTVLMIISIAMICAFFLISATYSGGFAMIEKHLNMYVLAIVTFLIILAEGIIIQQKAVDITKIMYPEKTASVYDLKFQKKWVDSCDEAEKIMIGRCAFEAFKVTNSVCGALSIILAISAMMFDIGFLPSLSSV